MDQFLKERPLTREDRHQRREEESESEAERNARESIQKLAEEAMVALRDKDAEKATKLTKLHEEGKLSPSEELIVGLLCLNGESFENAIFGVNLIRRKENENLLLKKDEKSGLLGSGDTGLSFSDPSGELKNDWRLRVTPVEIDPDGNIVFSGIEVKNREVGEAAPSSSLETIRRSNPWLNTVAGLADRIDILEVKESPRQNTLDLDEGPGIY